MTVTSVKVAGSNNSDFVDNDNCGGRTYRVTRLLPKPSPIRTERPRTSNAAVIITDSAPNSSQTLPLGGAGILPAVTLSPANTTFLDQDVFTTSPALPVALTNDGTGILVISKIVLTGPFVRRPTAPAASVLE